MKIAEVKLKKENKQKWIKALRSDNYKQIEGTLVNSRGYCCLGVYGKAVDNFSDEIMNGNSELYGLLDPEGNSLNCSFPKKNDGIANSVFIRLNDGISDYHYKKDEDILNYVINHGTEKQKHDVNNRSMIYFTFEQIADLVEMYVKDEE